MSLCVCVRTCGNSQSDAQEHTLSCTDKNTHTCTGITLLVLNSSKWTLNLQGNLVHSLTLRCPIRNALFSSIHWADIKAQCRSGPLIRVTVLFVNQHAGEFRAQVGLTETVLEWKENQCRTHWLHFIKFWFNEFIIKPFSSRLIQFGPSLMAYCLCSWGPFCVIVEGLVPYFYAVKKF